MHALASDRRPESCSLIIVAGCREGGKVVASVEQRRRFDLDGRRRVESGRVNHALP